MQFGTGQNAKGDVDLLQRSTSPFALLVFVAVVGCAGCVIPGSVIFPVGIFVVRGIFSGCLFAGAILSRVICILVTVG